MNAQHILYLLNKAVEADDPAAAAAILEWSTIVAGIAGLAHLLGHIDPAVLAQAAQDAANCEGNEAPNNVH